MVKLFVSTFDRLEYLKESLHSLLNSFSAIYPEIVITDDGSINAETKEFLEETKLRYPGKMRIIWNERNKGIPFGKLDTIQTEILEWPYDHEYFIISDSDMIYKKGWLENLVYLYESTKAPIITGFNTNTTKYKTTTTTSTYEVKHSVPGCNLLINTAFYKKYPFNEKQEWDIKMCEHAHKEHELGVIASRPSVVESSSK